MTTSPVSKFAATLFSLLVLLSAIAGAQNLQIGSGNTAIADPPVPRPHTKPCKVTLYQGFVFADFNPRSFSYTPPAACAGPWAKVILEADFSISQGIQFDRTANIWLGPTNIYFGTTAEPSPNLAPLAHRARSHRLQFHLHHRADRHRRYRQPRQPTYTGVIIGSATLDFYPAGGKTAPVTADQVIPFSSGPLAAQSLSPPTSVLAQTSHCRPTSSAPISTSLRRARMTTNSGTPAFPTTSPGNSTVAATPPSANLKSPSTARPPASLRSIRGSTPAASILISGSRSLAFRR